MKKLKGQTAIVYGASGPLGSCIAIALGREGADVVVHYHRNKSAAADVVARVRDTGAQAIALSADVTAESAVEALIDQTLTEFSSVDCVVNSVHGPFEPRLIAESTWEDWRVHLDALKGHFVICKTVLPIMRKQRSGKLVFVLGGLSHRLFGGFSAFSTVKAGLNAFSKTLALEEGKYGITVNIVAPGKVVTEVGAAPSSPGWRDIEEHQLGGTPLGRYASVEDVAEAVLFFLSPGASGMTGQTLFVAAGEVMG